VVDSQPSLIYHASVIHRAVLFYTGRDVVPFSERIHALPVSALWQSA
jgi:hypothetical protein